MMSEVPEIGVETRYTAQAGGLMRRDLPPAEILEEALRTNANRQGQMRVRDECLVRLALIHGLSFEQIADLLMTDADLDRQMLTPAGQECIELSPDTVQVVRDWLAVREALIPPTDAPRTEALFLCRLGLPLKVEQVRNLVRKAECRAWQVQATRMQGQKVRRRTGYEE